MSGFSRNLMPAEKIHNLPVRYLPDILPERSSYSPSSSRTEYGGSSKYRRTDSSILDDKKRILNSTASSAASRRFQDFFYRSGWPSLSDTDSPGCLEIDSSGSSASSMFSWADPDATTLVAEEWEKIQRTLYDEPGPKVLQKHLIDECNQWKSFYPHLRIIGKRYKLKNEESDEFHDTEEEILATQYDSDADSTLTIKAESTPNIKQTRNRKLVKQKANMKLHNNTVGSTVKSRQNAIDLIDELDQYLHITSIDSTSNYTKSPRVDGTSSIIRSEMSSSRWRHKDSSPDFVSLPYNSRLNVYQHSSNFNNRDNSATSSSSLLSKPSFIKSNISVPQSYNVMRSIDSKGKKSACSIQITSERHSRIQETNALSKAYPYRSISIPQDFSLPKNSTSKGRNVYLPPLEVNEFKARQKDQQLNYKSVSGRRRSNTRIKNLSPIYSNNHSKTELIVHENKVKNVSSPDVKKSKRKRKKLSKINS
ncbi:uncharacterized protein LOC143912520 isoform X2 [Arctopsyche grandis]|uniref:uncharacterized protein LOC143912520 isoform X2 n=1 Tax=Arctopsyche grandis TaxID=121162 RepID=UPI00406D9435